MGWLSRFPGRRAARQGIVASAIGAGLAVTSVAAGPLYQYVGTRGYFVMGAIAVTGLGLLIAARRLDEPYPQSDESGGKMTLPS
jgi:hypothetical protein